MHLINQPPHSKIDFLMRHPAMASSLCSSFLAADDNFLLRWHKQLNWNYLMMNELIEWNFERLKKFEKHLIFENDKPDADEYIELNNAIDWSVDMIHYFKDRISFEALCNNNYTATNKIEIRLAFADEFLKYCGSNQQRFFHPATASMYKNYDEFYKQSEPLNNTNKPTNEITTIEQIRNNIDAINWWQLSHSRKLNWSIELIAEFENYWDWEILSENNSLPLTDEMIDRFEDKWIWGGTIIKYEEYYNFPIHYSVSGLAFNDALVLNEFRLQKYMPRLQYIDFKYWQHNVSYSLALLYQYEHIFDDRILATSSTLWNTLFTVDFTTDDWNDVIEKIEFMNTILDSM